MAKAKESFSHLTLLAIEAALLGGDLLRQGFGTHFKIANKEGRHNLVTEYDHRSEKEILRFLVEQGPPCRFVAEESGSTGDKKSSLVWIVDPLDGTVNFAHGIPMFSVSIGAELDGVLFCGVIYQPMTHELFVTEKGKGAFLNGAPIHVSSAKTLRESILATGFPYNLAENPSHCIEHFVDVLRAGTPIRRIGSAAIDLAYTAAGRFEGFFEVSLCPWDCAAGALMIDEAGGQMSDWKGAPFDLYAEGPILASNGLVHSEIVDILARRIVR